MITQVKTLLLQLNTIAKCKQQTQEMEPAAKKQ